MIDSPLMLNSPAPDFTLPSTDGEQVTLSEVLKSGNVLLVFLRHLG
jgi:peroxiredoxin